MRPLRGMIIRVVFTVGCQYMPDYSEQFPCYGHLHLHFVLLSDLMNLINILYQSNQKKYREKTDVHLEEIIIVRK